MEPKRTSRFLRLLQKAGHLSEDQIEEALALHLGTKRSLVECVAKLGFLDEDSLLELLSAQTRCETVELDGAAPDPELIAKLPFRVAHQHGALALRVERGRAIVALSDPTDVLVIDELSSFLGMPVKPVLAKPSAIEEAVLRAHRPEDAVAYAMLDRLSGERPYVDVASIGAAPGEEAGGEAVVRIVQAILADAVRQRASDVHLEPHEGVLQVRFRVDGILRDVQVLPSSIRQQVVSRIKILASMDITIQRRPQDARAKVRIDDRVIDLRISTLPTVHGEKVVCRLLDVRNLILDLERLFDREVLRTFEGLLLRPQGMLLVTGPTGSGKTTTLYSAISRIRDRAINIVTLEDPVEYELEGLNQVEIDDVSGLTFPIALRSVLRQDPNVVLLGEIRDSETAQVAFRAAVTGHLLLSTLHTNDASSAIVRLTDLGLDPSVLTEALAGIVAQRLIRRLCAHCRVPTEVAEGDPDSGLIAPGTQLFAPRGCERCDYQGYRGRVAAFEILTLTPSVKALIHERRPEQEIRAEARRAGVLSMFDHGIRLALAGLTTLEAVRGGVPRDPVEAAVRCRRCTEPLERTFRVCPRCGEPSRGVCRGCHAQLRAGWSFCAQCGRPTGEAVTPAGTPSLEDPGSGASDALEVLVADDAAEVRMILKAALSKEGFVVREAASGEEALREIATRRPAALVLDYQMPEIDGIEVCRRLRARLDTVNLPVLMLTGAKGEDIESLARQAGADDYLAKPVRPKVLVQRIRLALGDAAAN